MNILLPDEPIDNASQFGFDSYSQALSSIIKSKNLQTPFTIAIHGDWGSGKTSLMKTVVKKLESSTLEEIRVKTIWFNAWEFEKIPIPLWKIFLNRIAMEIQDMVKDKELKSKIKAMGQGLLILSSDIILRRFIDVNMDNLTNIKNQVWDDIKRVNSLKEDFSELLEKALKNDPNKRERFVIFIDDLDRYLPERCVEVFESIKLFLNSPKCVFVIGINKDQIHNALKKKFLEDANTQSIHYMEKFIQLQFDLPRKTSEEIQAYLNDLSSEQLKKSPKTIELISRFIEPNPRKIKRWINSVLFLEKLFSTRTIKPTQILKPQIDVSIVSIWLFIKSFFPDFATIIENDLSLFNLAIKMTKGQVSDLDMEKIGDFVLDKRLNEFLSTLEPNFDENQLKEIVYLSKLTPVEQVSTVPALLLDRIEEMSEEELIDQLKKLTDYGTIVLLERIIDSLTKNQDINKDYDKMIKKYNMLDNIFKIGNDNIKKLTFKKILYLMNQSFHASRFLSSSLITYISFPMISEIVIKENHLDDIINIFNKSSSFNNAHSISTILLKFNEKLSSTQIEKIVDASLKNRQIYDSYGAQDNLTEIFTTHKSQIKKGKIEELNDRFNIDL